MELVKGFLYVLELEEGKYYVGFSKNVEARLVAHRAGKGAAWTKKYPMVKELCRYADKTPLDEDGEVKRLMLQHGIDNVRGGSYVRVKLPETERQTLEKELQSATGVCWKCGQKGHYVGRCPGEKTAKAEAPIAAPKEPKAPRKAAAKTEVPAAAPEEPKAPRKTAAKAKAKRPAKVKPAAVDLGPTFTLEQVKAISELLLSKPAAAAQKEVCAICGRNTHSAETCYATRTIDGKYIPARPEVEEEEESSEEEFLCTRCGRDGHIAEDCYAKRHVDGRTLP